MDKLVLTSSKALSDTSRYAVGVMRDNSLHLSPITTVLAMRPSFSYLDQADKRGRQDRKDMAGEEGDTLAHVINSTEKSLKWMKYNYHVIFKLILKWTEHKIF